MGCLGILTLAVKILPVALRYSFSAVTGFENLFFEKNL